MEDWFGLARLIEMFERRFGRYPTTGLMAIGGLALLAFCLNMIWNYVIDPVVGFFWGPSATLWRLLGSAEESPFAIIIFVGVAGVLIASAVLVVHAFREFGKSGREVKCLKERLEELEKNIRTEEPKDEEK